MTALLDTECQLTALGDGVYERECSQVWWGWEALHGGYVMALAQTAIDAELGHDMELQHCTVHYMRRFVDGPFRAEVTVERTGRTMANATARLRSGGKPAGLVLASFARRRPVAEFRAAAMPEVAPVGVDEAPTEPPFPVPTFDKFHLYPRIEDLADGAARVGGWVLPRTPEIVDHRYLGLLADLWPPVAYHVWPVGAIAQSVDLTFHARSSLPHPGLTDRTPLLVVLTTRASMGGFVDEDTEIWSPEGELLSTSRQMRYVHS